MKRESMLILSVVLGLTAVGVLMVFSASAAHADPYGQLVTQLSYVAVGLLLMFVAARVDYHVYAGPLFSRFILVIALALLVLVLIPGIGLDVNGARRWLEIGGRRFQPSEFAKFALVLILAVKLSQNQEEIKGFSKGFLPPMVLTAVFCGLIALENDLGGPAVLGAVAVMMMFIAGVRLFHLVPSMIPAAAAFYLLIVSSPHRVRRMAAFLNPWDDPLDRGHHLIQSLAGFARGGVWGVGPGAGEQKLHYLYAADSDFIFAVWGEEMGLVGSLLLVCMFVMFLSAAIRVAMHAPDLYGSLLALGIVFLIVIQAAFNMAVTVGLLPTKGLTLPFISAGGTSLVVFLAMAGVLLNIGLQVDIPRRITVPATAS